MNTKQQTLLEEINHNVVAIGRFLIESLTPKRKKEGLVPKSKCPSGLAGTAFSVLEESKEGIAFGHLKNEIRARSVRFDDHRLKPVLKRLIKKGAIEMRKSSNKHMYSITQKPKRTSA